MRKEELLRRIKNVRRQYQKEALALARKARGEGGNEWHQTCQRVEDLYEFTECLKELYTRAEPDDDQPTD